MDALSPRRAALAHPARVALVTESRTWTFAELWTRAGTVLHGLDPRAGQPIAFIADLRWETVALVWALFEAGIPLVPLHPKWTPADRARALAAVASVRFVEPDVVVELARREACASPAGGELDGEQLAAILFTSGTSARPRGACLSRRAFLASAAAHVANLPFLPEDRWLLALPFAHVGGLSILTRALIAGSAVVLLDRFEPGAALRAIALQRVTLVSVVPTVLADLLAADTSGVLRAPRAVLVGGAALSPALREDARQRGVALLATYGLTETCSQVATADPTDALASEAFACGAPLKGFDVRIVGANGQPVPRGVQGRIEVRGPALFSGYLAESARDPNDYFDTRDAGRFDDHGRLVVLGRADETIVTGGENVFPLEVEAVIATIAGVREVAAFGAPDPRWGEVVAVALALAPGAQLSHVFSESRVLLATFKRPRKYALVDALPRGASGKVDRQAVARLELAPVPAGSG